MKAKELHDMSDAELAAKVKDLREEHFKLRFQKATRQLENTAGLRKVRRDIAQVLTVLAQKQGAGA